MSTQQFPTAVNKADALAEAFDVHAYESRQHKDGLALQIPEDAYRLEYPISITDLPLRRHNSDDGFKNEVRPFSYHRGLVGVPLYIETSTQGQGCEIRLTR
jgi:hypothetical protein